MQISVMYFSYTLVSNKETSIAVGGIWYCTVVKFGTGDQEVLGSHLTISSAFSLGMTSFNKTLEP